MSSHKQRVVAAVIVDDLARPTRVLAARRTGPEELAGLWEFPGGKIEPGESPLEALAREIREELDVTLIFGDEIPKPAPSEWDPDDQARVTPLWPISEELELLLFTAQIVAGEPEPNGAHDELRWVSPTDWHDIRWLEPDLPVLAELRGWIRSWR